MNTKVEQTPAPSRPPLTAQTELWRYMDLGRFLALIDEKQLYFSRLHELDDPWEGAWHPSDPFLARDPEWMRYGADAFNTEPLVSCWHENETESVAMWKLYVSGREGVAFKTSVASLIRLFAAGRELKIGRIGYWDVNEFERSPEVFVFEEGGCIGNSDLLPGEAKIFRKNKGYAHENEVRLLLYERYCARQAIFNAHQVENIQGLAIGKKLSLRPGIKLAVDLSVLIQRIVVSPSFPTWAVKSLQKAVDSALAPSQSVKVEPSVLRDRPVVGNNRDRTAMNDPLTNVATPES